MSGEAFEGGAKIFDRIPQRERNNFQSLLMKLMLGEQPIHKDKKEWRVEQRKWFDAYGGVVSDIIDNPKNKEIRDLIMVEKYTEASSLVIKMLGEDKINKAA